MLIKIDSIKIGARFRKDLGNLGPFTHSIKLLGQLVAIGVSKDLQLIHGARRLAACTRLNITEIEAIELKSSTEAFSTEAEVHENIHRKDFTNFEIAEIDQCFREKFEAEARLRQKKGRKLDLSEIFAKGKSASKIAAMIGKNRPTDRKNARYR